MKNLSVELSTFSLRLCDEITLFMRTICAARITFVPSMKSVLEDHPQISARTFRAAAIFSA